MTKLNQLSNYIPRHLRLGVCCVVPEMESFQEFSEDIPIVDNFGNVVETRPSIKRVPAVEAMQKYKLDAFRLSARVRNGVPLQVVNVNGSSSVTIDQLERICNSLDGADSYVQKCLAQQKERESWFKPIEEDSKVIVESN